MSDMTTMQPRRICPAHPSTIARPQAAPVSVLVLLPHWRVDAPAPAPVTAADARAGRARALAAKAARKAAAFQPVEVVLLNPDFRARVAAIEARRGVPEVCMVPVTTARPLLLIAVVRGGCERRRAMTTQRCLW